jgi:hypothetical protein
MTKHQQQAATEHEQGHEANTSSRTAQQPATAMVRQMLASGRMDPHAIAGNGFATEVSSLVVAKGGLGAARDVVSFDQSSEYMESRATIDAPAAEEAPKKHGVNWVAKAKQYNRDNDAYAATFRELTGTACVDATTGELDPRKIARWQVDHGVPPDGRIGDQTISAAIVAS